MFAPLGGDVGPYHYEPGISIGFAGTAMGIAASGSARITLVPPNLHADLDVGEVVFGTGTSATRIKGTHLLFDVTPTSVLIEASGGISIANGPDAAVRLNVNAALLPPSASATFNLDVTNWNLPFGGASVQELHASANLAASFGSLPSGSLTVNGVLRAGTTNVTASGSLTLSNGRLTAMALQGNVSNFAIAGVSFTGPGCDGTGPQTGACISAGFNAAQNPPLSLGVAGSHRGPRSRCRRRRLVRADRTARLRIAARRRTRESDDHRRPVVRQRAPGCRPPATVRASCARCRRATSASPPRPTGFRRR